LIGGGLVPFVRIWKSRLKRLFGIGHPSAKSPAWLAYIFVDGEPAGLIDYKWRVRLSQINDLWIRPMYNRVEFLLDIVDDIEGEAEFLGHKSIEIRHINGLPIRSCIKTPIYQTFLDKGFFLKNENLLDETQ
jgi:hypothetical protein